ncbi:uncharacterized protein EV420DRAFT_151849 [Desarmillaria tabescens]|uniref:Uncharacterized protein n=1 Tax=Armillaria tabescens TaxID=1929756 RepID=A0AA39MLT2_ARMTA|nr:uncharacterized protein EV420DRAFT_151849 [Desarmillaria tabescens]KAK0438155.1 hypothetical protein EV420DRAFT_151849 [Desarmillaria tabescens]
MQETGEKHSGWTWWMVAGKTKDRTRVKSNSSSGSSIVEDSALILACANRQDSRYVHPTKPFLIRRRGRLQKAPFPRQHFADTPCLIYSRVALLNLNGTRMRCQRDGLGRRVMWRWVGRKATAHGWEDLERDVLVTGASCRHHPTCYEQPLQELDNHWPRGRLSRRMAFSNASTDSKESLFIGNVGGALSTIPLHQSLLSLRLPSLLPPWSSYPSPTIPRTPRPMQKISTTVSPKTRTSFCISL